LFRDFLLEACQCEERLQWAPRASQAFREYLKQKDLGKEKQGYSDRSVNRNMAHIKAFVKWIHKLKPFPLDNPMAKPVGTGLEVERAITPAERRRILDAADSLRVMGGRSKDRHRYRGKERPERKGYRPYRNRAIVYTLIETGMRRAAVRNLNLKDINFKKKAVRVEEKGGRQHEYKISSEGLAAIADYIERERNEDFLKWQSPALFLSARTTAHGNGRLNPRVVNTIWNEICKQAGMESRTPHDARHAMGRDTLSPPYIGNWGLFPAVYQDYKSGAG
jgi:integrase